MQCPWCGSRRIVWDMERGEVVCSDCGTVIDRIYVNQINISDPEYLGRQDHQLSGKAGHAPTLSKYTLMYLRLLKKIKSSKRLRNIEIDFERFKSALSEDGSQVKVLRRKKELVDAALSRDRRIKAVLKVMLRFPRLYSRTDRAKVAIAMLALALALGREANARKVAEESGVSVMHVRRLERILRRETEFINEVRKVIEAP